MALPEHYVPFRIPMAAAALQCLLPGAGQAYNHQPIKGLVLGGGWLLLFGVVLYFIRHPYSNLFLAGMLLAWAALWVDAYVTASRVNGQNCHPRTALAVLCGILATFGLIVTLLQMLGANLFVIKTIGTTVMAPEIQRGDLVLVNHTAFWFGSPKRGELLQFNPERFTIERPGALVSEVTSVNMTDYFQRVLAVAGDKVERRGGVCYVNGQPVPKELDAIGAEMIGDHGPFTVPKGRVYAPITGIPGDVFQGLAQAFGASAQHRVGVPGLIYQGLEEANMPGRKQWLARGVALINPPVRRRWY